MSSETIAEKQVRLVLEQQCAEVFGYLWSLLGSLRAGKLMPELTLVVFDFGDGGDVAFKTSLPKVEFLATLAGVCARWATRRVVHDPTVPLLDGPGLERLHRRAARLLPAGVGHAILVGRGAVAGYISNAERVSVAELFGELITNERAAMARAAVGGAS